jgi:hypothetical protein
MRVISHKGNSIWLAAVAAGLKTFETGKPCRNGHTTGRHTATGGCIECQRLRDKKRRRSRSRVKQQVATAAAKTRFNRPAALGSLINDYRNSAECHQRSKYLDNLIRKIA